MSTIKPVEPLHVVIAGGGIAALEALMALRDRAEERVRITMIAPDDDFVLKPLRTAEPFSVDHVRRRSLRDVADQFGAELLRDSLRRVARNFNTAVCESGAEVEYDALVLTPGAQPYAAYDKALTFGLEPYGESFNALLADIEQGYSRSVAFVVPPGVSWPLPLYELALMTARAARSMGMDGVQLTIISPEGAPLAIFGPHASSAVRDLLDQAGVGFWANSYATIEQGGDITVVPGHEHLHADRVVALPLLQGPRLAGVPCDEQGFIPVDEHGRVAGMRDVYAAGDATNFPVKQGGIACQQADAVAEHIAARGGAPIEPRPFRPVLRGKLLTGAGAQFLRHDLHGGAGESQASMFELWFPPAKVAGHYLGQWLAMPDGISPPARATSLDAEHIDVEVPLPHTLRTGDDPLSLEPLGALPARGR
jgi:sulfide:quinone oxidoreductase